MTIEPSRSTRFQANAPDSRIFGTREQMQERMHEAFAAWRRAELSYAPTMAALYARHYGVTLAHWGLALMELSEQEVTA